MYKDLGFTAATFEQWRTGLKELADFAKNKQYDAVLAKCAEVRAMYPDYIGAANAYEFIAEADLATGNKQAAAAVLTDYEKIGGENPDTLKELASLEEELGNSG